MRNLLVMALAWFVCAQFASAQITVRLHDGQDFIIEGKEIFEDGVDGKVYLKETADTVHVYAYKKLNEQVFTLQHTRIPLDYFSKAAVKANKAEFKYLDRKKTAGKYIVNMRTRPAAASMEKGNDFIINTYSASGLSTKNDSSTSIYFTDVAEAKAFHKRFKDAVKNR